MTTKPTEIDDAPTWQHYTRPGFVSTDGVRTAFRRKGTGEALLYLHDECLTGVWLPFLDALARGADVIAPEHPGFGESELTDQIQSFEDLVLHYDSFLTNLGSEPVHLVGQGLGGWIASNLAIFYPTRFKSVTLITPTGLRLLDVPSIDTFRMTGPERVAALYNGREADNQDMVVQRGEQDDMIKALVESAATARLAWNPRYDHRLDHRLGRVSAPTLVVAVTDDRYVPGENASTYGKLIQSASLVTLQPDGAEPTSHMVHVEHPEELAALVLGHVAAHS